MREIENLIEDKAWGDSRRYDIIITKVGEAKETKYSVRPQPVEKLNEVAVEAWKDIKDGFNLQNMFDNQSPFPKKREDTKKSSTDKEEEEEEINIDDIPFS